MGYAHVLKNPDFWLFDRASSLWCLAGIRYSIFIDNMGMKFIKQVFCMFEKSHNRRVINKTKLTFYWWINVLEISLENTNQLVTVFTKIRKFNVNFFTLYSHYSFRKALNFSIHLSIIIFGKPLVSKKTVKKSISSWKFENEDERWYAL